MTGLRQPARIAAEFAEVRTCTLRRWVARGHIPAPVDGLYDLTAIVAWLDRHSHRHAVAARHQRGTRRRDTPAA